MEYKNYMEESAAGGLEELWPRYKNVCGCRRCKLDIIALALNNLPAKYVVTDIGRAHTKLAAVRTQFQADITRELVKAIKKVSENLRH